VQNGNLYIALYPEIVGAAVTHVPAKGKSIADNPAFISLMKRLGGHLANAPSSFGYFDLPKLAPENYSTWLVISHLDNAADLFGIQAPNMILPPLDKLLEHLSPAGDISWTDADGLHVNGVEPFPASSLLASSPNTLAMGEIPVLISIMLPALSQARHAAQDAKSAANLRQIGMAAMIYANENRSSMPNDIGQLVLSHALPAEVCISPQDGAAPPAGLTLEQQAQWVNQHGSYVWNGAGMKLDASNPSTLPLAWEKLTHAGKAVPILYGDGHVEMLPRAQAVEIIRAARERKPR
jgi:prepilin-type processing-associated H-X9-DG protein